MTHASVYNLPPEDEHLGSKRVEDIKKITNYNIN